MGFCTQQDFKFIVTELMDGGSLDQLIHCGSKISFDKKLSILLDVTKAMVYLHSMKTPLIHRDIKPSNILVGAAINVLLTFLAR